MNFSASKSITSPSRKTFYSLSIREDLMTEDLIAPCGMNCGICSGYLAFSNNIPKKKGKISHCRGCRPRNKQCAYIKGHCDNLKYNRIKFCFECTEYPCERLKHFDERYKKNYEMSLIENLNRIKNIGLSAFITEQNNKYKCPNCNGVICVHNKKCYSCETVDDFKS